MRIGYLKYQRGFTTEDFKQLLDSDNDKGGKNDGIASLLLQKSIDSIYLPVLEINLADLKQFPGELYGLPLRLNKKIAKGFSIEMVSWLKENAVFAEFEFNRGYLTEKLENGGIELWIFDTETQTVGRSMEEHQDNQMLKIEVSIDDMNPEFYGYILDKLFAAGANDVYIEQVIMKKNRPGQILHILCQNEKKDEFISLIFAETTTLGIRYTPYTVHRLKREFVSIETEWGIVRLKIGYFQGNLVQMAPEYEECVNIAKKHNLPLKLVCGTIQAKGYAYLQQSLSMGK